MTAWLSDHASDIQHWADVFGIYLVETKDDLVAFIGFLTTDFSGAMTMLWDGFVTHIDAAGPAIVDALSRLGHSMADSLLNSISPGLAQIVDKFGELDKSFEKSAFQKAREWGASVGHALGIGAPEETTAPVHGIIPLSSTTGPAEETPQQVLDAIRAELHGNTEGTAEETPQQVMDAIRAELQGNTTGNTPVAGAEFSATLTANAARRQAALAALPTRASVSEAEQAMNAWGAMQPTGGTGPVLSRAPVGEEDVIAKYKNEVKADQQLHEAMQNLGLDYQQAAVYQKMLTDAIAKHVDISSADFKATEQAKFIAEAKAVAESNAQKAEDQLVLSTKQQIDGENQLHTALDASSLSGSALTEYQKLLNEAIKDGIPLTQDLKDQLQGLAQQEVDASKGYASGDFFGGFSQGVTDFKTQLKSVGDVGHQVATDAIGGISHALAQAATGAKTFGDAMREVLLKIADTLMETAMNSLIGNFANMLFGTGGQNGQGGTGGGAGGLVGGIIGGIGSLFKGGGGGGGSYGALDTGEGSNYAAMSDFYGYNNAPESGGNEGASAAAGIGMDLAGMFMQAAMTMHSGGLVGMGHYPSRMLSVGALSYAPRLHTGLQPNEFAAVLQRGEKVTSVSGVGAENKSYGVMIDLLGQLVAKDTAVTLMDKRQTAAEYLASRDGEKQVMKHVQRNQS